LSLAPLDVAAELTATLHEYLTNGKPDRDRRLQRRLRELADALEPAAELAITNQFDARAERAVFTYWQRAMGKPHAKLTPERRAKIRARFSEGYLAEDMQKAIDYVSGSDWHRGGNDRGQEYVDLTMILQTGSKLEGYVAHYEREHGGSPQARRARLEAAAAGDPPAQQQLALVELEKTAGELLRRGETQAYNLANRQLRSLRSGREG
jgi:uncharacterized phage protein (TIGR02220 family)